MHKKIIVSVVSFAIFVVAIFFSSQLISQSKTNKLALDIMNDDTITSTQLESYMETHPNVSFVMITQVGDGNSDYLHQVLIPNLYALYPNTDFTSIVRIEVASDASAVEIEAIKNKFGIQAIPALVHLDTTQDQIEIDERYEWIDDEFIDLSNLEAFLTPYEILVP
ncbi:MAG: hypothetical protein ACRCZJ_03430 [Erysipelotrichaceae bacterium]